MRRSRSTVIVVPSAGFAHAHASGPSGMPGGGDHSAKYSDDRRPSSIAWIACSRSCSITFDDSSPAVDHIDISGLGRAVIVGRYASKITSGPIDQISSRQTRSADAPWAFCGVAAVTNQRVPSGNSTKLRPYDQLIFPPCPASRIGASSLNRANARSSLCAALITVCGRPAIPGISVSHQPISAIIP